MAPRRHFQRRGIVEGFYGPLWSMSHRAALFEFGARRGMNTYLYAPKDDPYHRVRWREPYPEPEWRGLVKLIRAAERFGIEFVYGFHPGKGLRFTAEEPVDCLLGKAGRFYDAGVRTFAILFDDIPSRLAYAGDRRRFRKSLAKAEAVWVGRVLQRQPPSWRGVEWWLCPSYYSEDPLLARVFGRFEPRFLETLAASLPDPVACIWTGPSVVAKKISLAHARMVARRLGRRLILWDNYPVNDLGMSAELHLGPLTGRDRRLPQVVYGYLNNPLLQEALGFLPLATCLDYAADPLAYDPGKSWRRAVAERFGEDALPHWLAIRGFCDLPGRAARKKSPPRPAPQRLGALRPALEYVLRNSREPWFAEFRPWLELLEKSLTSRSD